MILDKAVFGLDVLLTIIYSFKLKAVFGALLSHRKSFPPMKLYMYVLLLAYIRLLIYINNVRR